MALRATFEHYPVVDLAQFSASFSVFATHSSGSSSCQRALACASRASAPRPVFALMLPSLCARSFFVSVFGNVNCGKKSLLRFVNKLQRSLVLKFIIIVFTGFYKKKSIKLHTEATFFHLLTTRLVFVDYFVSVCVARAAVNTCLSFDPRADKSISLCTVSEVSEIRLAIVIIAG
jgi:hypothetical protein